MTNQFVISSPSSGADVSVDDKIVGNTPLPDMNHYILVAPVKTGAAFVQDQPAVVNPDNGTFVGRARFGNTGVGEGEQFIVRVLASKATLPVGPLTNSPADAVVSNSVTIRRKK